MPRDEFQKSVQGEPDFRRQALDRKAQGAFTESVRPVVGESDDDAGFCASEFMLRRPDPAITERTEMFEVCSHFCFWLALLSPVLMVVAWLYQATCVGPFQASTAVLIGSVLFWLISIGLGTSVAYHGARCGCWWATAGMGINGVWGLAVCYQAMTVAGPWNLLRQLFS